MLCKGKSIKAIVEKPYVFYYCKEIRIIMANYLQNLEIDIFVYKKAFR